MKKEPIPPYILYYVFRHLRTPVRLLSADRKQLKEHVFPDFSDETKRACWKIALSAAFASDAAPTRPRGAHEASHQLEERGARQFKRKELGGDVLEVVRLVEDEPSNRLPETAE